MPYGLYIFLADIHTSSTVLFYQVLAIVCAALRLHDRYAARVVVIYIFEHLHTSTVMIYKYASLRLHGSNATSASTPQEYSVMHSLLFFLRAFALIKI